MTDVRAVLFDFAGTVMMPLAAPDWVGRAARALGVDLSPAQVEDLAARYLAAGLPGGPYPDDVPADVDALYRVRDLSAERHRAAYTALLSTVPEPHPGFTTALYEQVLTPGGWVAYPDAAPTVAALQRAGLRVGLISNIGYDVRDILRAHGLGALAQRCTLSCEHGAMKPDRRLFAAALDTLETEPAHTLMIGDSASMDTGGVALGIRTLVLPMSAPGQVHGLSMVAGAVRR